MTSELLLAMILMIPAGTMTAQASASNDDSSPSMHHLTQKEARRLLYSATTAGDHRALADYYRREAERLRKKEQSYLNLETDYRQHPPHADAYRNSPTAVMYRELADSARDLAYGAEALARYQDQLAKQLEASK